VRSELLAMLKLGKFLVIIVLVLGLFFRFANLEKKAYSADEVRSVLRLSGYANQEFEQLEFTGDIISASQIVQQYQKPTKERNLQDTLIALAENPEHPPLYHLLTRFWMQIFNTPVAARVASIIFGVLALPCIYWLCIELFNSPLAGWIAIMLVSISPYNMLLDQNTTQYSLWTIAISLSSATLIKALRESSRKNWLLYTLSFTLGIYTHLFFAIVAFTQGVYVVIVERFRLKSKVFLSYILASLGGALAFSPWLFVIFTSLDKINNNTQYYRQSHASLSQILTTFKLNLCGVFIDFHGTTRLVEKYLDILILILIVYSLYFLIRNTAFPVWLFLVLLITITPLVHIIPDAFGQSVRSLQTRYYLPCFLGIQLSVAYLFASKLSAESLKEWSKNAWKIVFLSLLSLGVVSGIYVAQIHSWEKGTASTQNLDLAPIINQAKKPLVISDTTPSFVLALSHLVKPDVQFQLFQDIDKQKNKLNLEQDLNNYSDVFLYFPDQKLTNVIESNNKFTVKTIKDKRIPVVVKKN
jgi:uncharacterized membrane protein